MQLPTEFGVGAGEVPRGERGEKGEFAREGTDGDAFGEGRRRWSRQGRRRR